MKLLHKHKPELAIETEFYKVDKKPYVSTTARCYCKQCREYLCTSMGRIEKIEVREMKEVEL